MNRRLIYLATAAMMAFAALASDGIDNLPVKQVNGRDCHYYEVSQGETVYSIARKLQISREDIEKANPSVRDGLRAGQTLYFPIEASSWQPRRHTVKPKETIYGIARQYGITTDQLIQWNSQARDGIRKDQVLIVSDPSYRPVEASSSVPEAPLPATSLPADQGWKASGTMTPLEPSSATVATVPYRIGEKESLYRIAINHNTTVSNLLALNPGLDENHYEAGQTIQVPVVAAQEASAVSDVRDVAGAPDVSDVTDTEEKAMGRYRVKSKETFYSIAHAHGLTIEQLEKANPEVGVLKEGMILNIPLNEAPAVEATPIAGGDVYAETVDPTMASPGRDTVMAAVEEASEPGVNVALMLPLMLNQSEQPKKAQLYTEFYKGFLLAVDTMRRCGTPINIHVFDTEGSAMRVGSLLGDSALTKVDVIIAPDDETQLAMLGNYARFKGVNVLNLFVVKDTTYRSNPAMMQGNIPHKAMYDKAITGLLRNYQDYTPVIVGHGESPDDKAEFIAALKKRLDNEGRKYHQITFDNILRLTDLAELDPEGSYVFIPVSGRQAELNRLTGAISEFREKSTQSDPVRIFGYPEWITFRGETLVNMHKLNTVVFSRFYTVPDDPAVRAVDDSFMRWYGGEMANYVPRQGTFGFDTGMFLIRWLSSRGADTPLRHSGIQNGFNFVRVPDGGWVNDELYLINFRPSGLIDKISL